MKSILRFSAGAAGAWLLFAGLPAHGQQTLFGTTFFDNQLISFNLGTGEATLVGPLGSNVSPYGLANRGGSLYTFDPNIDRIRQINPTTGAIIGSPIDIGVGNLLGEGDIAFRADGLGFLTTALNPTTFEITNDFFSFNLLTGTSTRIGSTGVTIDALAFSPTGTLFALGQGEGRLFTINTATGATTVVGELNVDQNSSFAGLTFAPDGTLYAAIDDQLFTVNPATGAATSVDPMGFGPNFGAISGLAFAVPEPTSAALLSVGLLLAANRRRRND